MANKKRLILVDGASYLYRAFHAMPHLANSSGQPTGAVYGVTNMVKKLLADEAPSHMAVIFDAPGKTFRHEMYSEYKANRPPMPSDMRTQIDYVHEIIKALGIPLLQESGVEADDVIGTLTTQATKARLDVLVSTGDKDLAQLVNKRVMLVDTMKGVTYDIDGVIEKYGVAPERIVDYLALIGDTSDNVPGVNKVGPKTAVKWLEQYGSLDGIVAAADEIKGKVGENLRLGLDQIPLSRQLVTIKTDCELELQPKELTLEQPNGDRLRELYAELEFKTWLGELGGKSSVAGGPTSNDDDIKVDYEVVMTQKSLDGWIKKLKAASLIAIDTETTSLNAAMAQLVGVSFSVEAGKAAYVPVGHTYEGAPKQLGLEAVLKKLKPLLEDPAVLKVGQNLKYDIRVLANYDVHMSGIEFDTMLESYVLDSTATRHDMDSLAMKYLGHKTVKFEDIAGKGKAQIGFNDVDLEKAGPYAAEDADITLRLHEHLWPKLKKNDTLLQLFEQIELPLVQVLARIESNGVKIDGKMLEKQSKELAKRAEQIEQSAYELAGSEFNIASPKQIQKVLFEDQGLPVLKKTPKGAPSTAEEVLQDLAHDYELPALILEHRSITKLKSTYTDKLPLLVNPDTNRIHTSYHQAVAATGRLSSSEPNLQNIPIRTAEGRRIRDAFVADSKHVLIAADYSQVELRIMAHLSRDEGLLHAFAEGLDVHRATAAEVFEVALDKVTDDQRRAAKAINFGLIYGMSAFGLGRQLKIERAAAQNYVDTYFARYPGVRKYMDATRAAARDQGYVETVFGRRLYIPEINASNYQRRQHAERTAINAPMQGTAADLIKKAMIVVDAAISESHPDARMIMQVHDELVVEVPAKSAKAVQKTLTTLMTGVAELAVPLEVDSGVGKNWAEAHS